MLTSLTTGNMFRQGSELTDAERRAVAGFPRRASGWHRRAPAPIVGRCTAAPAALQARDLETGWNGWGAGAANTRYKNAAHGGITAADAPKLKLKWAIGFAGVNSARAQPAVIGGRVFVGSESGDVLALNAKTGCTYWRYHAQAGIRTAVSVGPYKPRERTRRLRRVLRRRHAVGLRGGRQHGREIWSRKLDDHILRARHRLADRSTTAGCMCRWPASAKKARADRRATSAARSAAA